jgi:hypothetical protein
LAVRPSDEDPPEDEPPDEPPEDPLDDDGVGDGAGALLGRSRAVPVVDPPVCVYPRPFTICPVDPFCELPFTMMIGGA